jgi:hypothetical protein
MKIILIHRNTFQAELGAYERAEVRAPRELLLSEIRLDFMNIF